jgi:hypothetical protein
MGKQASRAAVISLFPSPSLSPSLSRWSETTGDRLCTAAYRGTAIFLSRSRFPSPPPSPSQPTRQLSQRSDNQFLESLEIFLQLCHPILSEQRSCVGNIRPDDRRQAQAPTQADATGSQSHEISLPLPFSSLPYSFGTSGEPSSSSSCRQVSCRQVWSRTSFSSVP